MADADHAVPVASPPPPLPAPAVPVALDYANPARRERGVHWRGVAFVFGMAFVVVVFLLIASR